MREVLSISGGEVHLGPAVGGHGLAELVSVAITLNLTETDFDPPEWRAYSAAFRNARNALYYLRELTPEEIATYTNTLRDTMSRTK